MWALVINTLNEKVRNRTLYIVTIIGAVIMLLITSGDGSLTINGRKVTGFAELVPVALSVINFIACLLAVMISIQTIPMEFERKTTHLVLVRGVKPWKYMFSVTVGNISASVACLAILYLSLAVFCMLKGDAGLVPRTLPCIAVLALNPALLSAAVSLLSIRMPIFLNGATGIALYLAGVLHDLISTAAGAMKGISGILLRAVLYVIPDLASVQNQATSVLKGGYVDFFPLVYGLLLLYVFLTLTFFCFRKEV